MTWILDHLLLIIGGCVAAFLYAYTIRGVIVTRTKILKLAKSFRDERRELRTQNTPIVNGHSQTIQSRSWPAPPKQPVHEHGT